MIYSGKRFILAILPLPLQIHPRINRFNPDPGIVPGVQAGADSHGQQAV